MFTRREFMRTGAGAALAASLGVFRSGPAGAEDNGQNARLVFSTTANAPVLTFAGSAIDRRSVSLLPAGTFLPNAIDLWYLWLWTHDTNSIYLFTAPDPRGPYTARGSSGPPANFPSGYVSTHFSSGDIVWDPLGRRLVSSPHSYRVPVVPGNAEVCQDSFLIQSTDGVNWTWLDGDNRPRLRCGPPGSPDSIHTGYGRLLRDLDGHLIRWQDRYWWLYRAQRRDAGSSSTSYVPYLASAPSLSADFTSKTKAFEIPGNSSLFDVGSFVQAAGVHTALMGIGSPVTYPLATFYNQTGSADMKFLPAPVPHVLPVPTAGLAGAGGGYLVRDPWSRKEFLAQGYVNLALNRAEVWILREFP